MSDATSQGNDARNGDPRGARDWLSLAYTELRALASQRMAQEGAGLTLQPTALVHEAYMRLAAHSQQFENRGHFFAAAAEAMRRILIEDARRRKALKRGGDRERVQFDPDKLKCASSIQPADELLALDAALTKLAAEDQPKAELVKLRYFAGLTLAEASVALGISHNTADRWWAYAKAFLYHEITSADKN